MTIRTGVLTLLLGGALLAAAPAQAEHHFRDRTGSTDSDSSQGSWSGRSSSGHSYSGRSDSGHSDGGTAWRGPRNLGAAQANPNNAGSAQSNAQISGTGHWRSHNANAGQSNSAYSGSGNWSSRSSSAGQSNPNATSSPNAFSAPQGRSWRHGSSQFASGHSNAFRFQHHNSAQFSSSERQRWHGGRWQHGNRHGRNGWWWGVGGAWYFYAQPIYPYPGYVSDYWYDDYNGYNGGYYDGADDQDSYDDESGPEDGGNYWYYCRDPQGYYPYVRQCNGPWERVRPTPQGQSARPGSNDYRDRENPQSDQDDDQDQGQGGPMDDSSDDEGPPPPPPPH